VAPRAYIGTSGWNYKHWRDSIYPPKLTQNKWLAFIAERFNTVEVNTSFYRIPRRESIIAWQEKTPKTFRFALKIWRGISHYKKLKNAGALTSRFLEAAEALERKRRAPLLIQLPPNQGRDVEKLEAYLKELQSLLTSPWEVAVEFRNDTWLHPDVYKALDRQQAALCIHDMPGRAATDEPNDVGFVYVRRHGTSEGRYAGSYSDEQLTTDATRIQSWTRSGKNVYVYFNNDIGGHAFRNADQLRSMIDVR
jgi:uncharacterized protein YecE (DUF72 family)